jgi:hypothetical protein
MATSRKTVTLHDLPSFKSEDEAKQFIANIEFALMIEDAQHALEIVRSGLYASFDEAGLDIDDEADVQLLCEAADDVVGSLRPVLSLCDCGESHTLWSIAVTSPSFGDRAVA